MPLRLAVSLLMLVTLLVPAGAGAQSGKVLRLGVLHVRPGEFDPVGNPSFRALADGLRGHGWVIGRNVVVEYRSAGGKAERLPGAAAELVALKPDVIVAFATTATVAAKSATSTIPIVMVGASDPVDTGLAVSLARPGGNVTGLGVNAAELSAKRVQLLKEAVPALTRVAVLWNSTYKAMTLGFQQIEIAAPTLGVTVQSVRVAGSQDFDAAFIAIAQGRPGGLVVLFGPMAGDDMPRIVEFTTKAKLPTVFEPLAGVDAGGFMALGPNIPDMARRAGAYVDKIATGARPADLPIEEPTKFDLMINMKTAKALGVTVPPTLLLRADHVIE